MAGVALTLNVSKADTARFAKLISRAQNELGKSPFDAVNWAGYFITRSMAAATKVAPKLRKIVKNPNPERLTRRAGAITERLCTVNKYDRSGWNTLFRFIGQASLERSVSQARKPLNGLYGTK